MDIGADFDSRFRMNLKIRSLEGRIEELESGGAYAKLAERKRIDEAALRARIKKLKSELAAQQRLARKMRKCWFEVFGQVEHERDMAVEAARAETRKMQERAFSAEHERDRLKDLATDAARCIRGLEEDNRRLSDEASRLRIQAARDFENSSVPSSAQGPARKPVPNTRKQTERKVGAQTGHVHHPRKRIEPTRSVEIPDPEGFKSDPDLYKTSEVVSKTVVSARVAVEATEYRASVWRRRSNGARVRADFPEAAKDELNYDGSVRALAFMLTQNCCVSIPKAKAFLFEASGGALDLSVGMICGLLREFSAKSAPEREKAVASLLSAPVMHADFTGANVNGKAAQVLILANGGACQLLARKAKGHGGVRETPLEGYAGCVIHDHDTTFYSYGTAHQECMQHNIRYLVGSTQNEGHLTWNKLMLGLVRSMIHARNQAPPGQGLDPKDAEALERAYDKVLAIAEDEYARQPPNDYYRDGYNLFKRLRDYRESQLRFLHEPWVAPDNSLCERLARMFKRKQHQAIAFRSFEHLAFVVEALSTLNNMRTSGRDVFVEVSAIFARPLPSVSQSPV